MPAMMPRRARESQFLTAGDVEDLPVDEFRFQKVCDGIGNIGPAACSLEGIPPGHLFECGFGRAMRRQDGAGGDGVHLDARREFLREDFRECDQAGLGDGVREVAGGRPEAAPVTNAALPLISIAIAISINRAREGRLRPSLPFPG